LSGVLYDVYESAIKRYGYVGRVRDESLKEVSDHINLSYSRLNDENSAVNHFYRASKGFDHGNYNVEHMLVLGFLNCAH
jgi:hypothetical protein